ncbi:hypothetical protein GO986_18635 [Deinococcus sp. HMF7620]|uniref:Uncharacterized protein n=1 Tax=Deinococcus arboris TaxID=2682977 RepID=A0A7C9MB47_9DEIO|nr:hypothetical protein [Deinococcus arboris]MVN88759.1 hypothetical protein [Deinococcus arboris]
MSSLKPDLALTGTKITVILDHLAQSPNAESGIKGIQSAFPEPRPNQDTVTEWVQILLERGLIRVTQHDRGRQLFGLVDLQALIVPEDVDDTLRQPILAVLSDGPAMAAGIAERLSASVRRVQSTALAMWRDNTLMGRPVGAGFVFRVTEGLSVSVAAAVLEEWKQRTEDDRLLEAPRPPSVETAHIHLPRHGTKAARFLTLFAEAHTIEEALTHMNGEMKRAAATSLLQRFLQGGFVQAVGSQGKRKTYELTHSGRGILASRSPTFLGPGVPLAPEGHSWTPARLEWLKAAFPILGLKLCAQRLGISVSPVHRRARLLALTYGDVPNYIKTAELASMVGISSGAMRDAAERAGVLTYCGLPEAPGHTLVPLEWADQRAERGAAPTLDEVLITGITQDPVALARIKSKFRAHIRYRTPGNQQRPQLYLPRLYVDQARAYMHEAPPKFSHWSDILPHFERAGANGLNIVELQEQCGLEGDVCRKHTRRAVEEEHVLERHNFAYTGPVYRLATFHDQAPPLARNSWVSPQHQVQPLLLAAGAVGATLFELLDKLPGIPVGRLERTLDDMVRKGMTQGIKGTWWQPTAYFPLGVEPAPPARPQRLDQPESAVASAIAELDIDAGVTHEQIALHLRQSYYQVTLVVLRLQNLQALTPRKEGREVYLHPLPPLHHIGGAFPSAPLAAPLASQEVSVQTQQLPLSQQLAELEQQAAPLETLQSELSILDDQRSALTLRIQAAQTARDVLARISSTITSVLHPLPSPAHPSNMVHIQEATSVSSPQPTVEDSERRRVFFPAPIPDALTPEALRVFKLVRELKDGLPFKQICAQLNMPSDQASKAIDLLTHGGHLRKVGSHYRAQSQAA